MKITKLTQYPVLPRWLQEMGRRRLGVKVVVLFLAMLAASFCLPTVAKAAEKNYCQACGKEVVWQLLTEDAAEETSLAEGHYRLSFSENSSAWIEKTVSGNVCIDLNGMTVQGINRIFTVPQNGTLSIQGEGCLTGGGFVAETTNAERIGSVAVVQKGGKLNLYGGTLRTALYAPENVYSYNGGALWVQGQLHMYGGRLEKGTATNAGGNVFIQTGGEMRMYDGILTGGSKRDVYCKGSIYLEGNASPGVVHLTKPGLTISGIYTGYLVVSAPELTDGMVLGVSENAQLRYGNISVANSENRLFLIEKDGQLILSQYQPDHPETIESRYCQACGRYADFIELTEYSGFMGTIRTGHYYLNFSQGSAEYQYMRLVQMDRVCLDLNGMIVYYSGNGFDVQDGCILNVMDSVGGGALRRLEKTSADSMVILGSAAELNLYGGSLVGAGNGDRCVSAPNGKIGLYGGEVKNGQLVCGEGTLQIGGGFSGRIAVTCDELLEGMPLGFGKGTCEILLPEDMRGEILRNGQVIAVAKDAAALLYRQDGSVKSFQDFTGAAEAFSSDDEKILLLGDVAERVSLSKDLRVDLNGYHITGETYGNGTLYCMDSATADYIIEDGICGSVTAAEHVQPVTAGMAGSEDTYLMIDQQGKLSFHCVTVKIQSMSLRPEEAGVYFTGDFAGDALVQQQVDRFGVMVSVEEDPVQTDNAVCRTAFSGENFNTDATSSLVYGIMRKDLPTEENRTRAATAVFARPYVRLADGQELIGDCVSRSLQQQMELACEQWNGFGIRQKQVLWDFYHTYKTEMYSSWNVTKMKNLDKRQAKIDAVDYTPYLIPWQKDAVAEAKADGKIHYYFMSGEGLIITEPDKTRWGDACLAVLPDGMTVLIDSGPEAYAPVLLRNLQRLGITKLDAIIISHPHYDHQNGVFSERAILHTGLLDKIPVGKIYWRGGFDPATTDDLLTPDAAAAYGIACEVLERGDVVYFGDIRLEVLWPMAGDGDSVVSNDLEINNFSVVFRLDYGEHSALFTGDLYVKGVSGEMMLLNRTDHSLLDADLMKVPHHGYESSSSASLIRAVSPEIAVAMGDHEIPESVFASYQEVDCNLLGDHYRGYVHIVAGADGFMTSETSRTAEIS